MVGVLVNTVQTKHNAFHIRFCNIINILEMTSKINVFDKKKKTKTFAASQIV